MALQRISAQAWQVGADSNNWPPMLLLIPCLHDRANIKQTLLITIVRRASWMNASKHRADVEQLARVF